MKDHLTKYMGELEHAIGEYMDRPVTERTAEAVDGMTECWLHLCKAKKKMEAYDAPSTMTRENAEHWAAKMVNDDGTTGAHWDLAQTTAVAQEAGVKFEHIEDWCWWIALNMMYSDYGTTAERFGVDTPAFFAALARDFLFDKDGPGPMEKLGAYYHGIVCRKNKDED